MAHRFAGSLAVVAVLALTGTAAESAATAATQPAAPMAWTAGEQAVERYFAPVVAACSRGDDKACRRLATRLHNASNDREVERLVTTVQKACGPTTPTACTAYGQALAAGIGVARDVGRAVALLDKACKARVDMACAQLAELYLADDPALPGKKDEGAKLARTSCETLGGWPCTTLAGLGSREPPTATAQALLVRGCDGGDVVACYQLGMIWAEGLPGLTPDAAKATARYAQACDGDLAPACFNLGWQYARGTGAPRDDKRAHALFERACQLSDASACDELARRDGKNREYCELWGAEACFALAEEISKQQGETAGAAEAIVGAGWRACKRGHSGACNVLGHLARDTIRQCDGGTDVANACTFAGVVYATGAGLRSPEQPMAAADRAKALEAFGRACKAGAAPACAAAKRLP